MKQVQGEAAEFFEQEKKRRSVQPGLALVSKDIRLNIAHSKNAQRPPPDDPTNIPVVMSLERQTKAYRVFDAVVHTTLFEQSVRDAAFRKDLVQLLVDCTKETFGVDMSTHTIEDNVYYEPYGWDEKGKPLTTEAAAMQAFGFPSQEPSDMTVHSRQTEEPLMDLKLRNEPTHRPLIQEVKPYTIVQTDRDCTIRIKCDPNVDCMFLTLKQMVHVSSPTMSEYIHVPFPVDHTRGTAKYLKKSKELILWYPRASSAA